MTKVIASRQMLIKDEEAYLPVTVTVSMPEDIKSGLFSCRVQFSIVPKYDANIKGSDGINALECALSYIDGICANSDDPEFHWEKSGQRHKGRPQ